MKVFCYLMLMERLANWLAFSLVHGDKRNRRMAVDISGRGPWKRQYHSLGSNAKKHRRIRNERDKTHTGIVITETVRSKNVRDKADVGRRKNEFYHQRNRTVPLHSENTRRRLLIDSINLSRWQLVKQNEKIYRSNCQYIRWCQGMQFK